MAFTKKTWRDRQSEHPTRRKLVPTGYTNEYDVVRSEGTVSQDGDALNADNLNDLESRISTAFSETTKVYYGTYFYTPSGWKDGDLFAVYEDD